MLELHNPHSILAALEARPMDVLKVAVPASLREEGTDAWNRVVSLAQKHKIPVVSTSSSKESRPHGRKDFGPGRVSAASATIKPRLPVAIESLFSEAKERLSGRGIWLAFDQIQDPQNLGSIFRTAAFFGVQGIVFTEERSAPLTSSAYDVAAGGVESVPYTVLTNLQRAFEKAKEAGLWILGSSEHAEDDISTISLDRPWLLVLGNEEKGMRRLTEETCDLLCKISGQGQLGSLNVSVAAGIMISALSR